MRGRQQLLITVEGLPRLTEMKSMKSLRREQSVMEAGTAADGGARRAQGCIVSAAKNCSADRPQLFTGQIDPQVGRDRVEILDRDFYHLIPIYAHFECFDVLRY